MISPTAAPLLLQLLLGGALVLAVAFQLARFSRADGELQRLWSAALALLLLLPILTAVLPSVPVTVPLSLPDLGIPIPPETRREVAPIPAPAAFAESTAGTILEPAILQESGSPPASPTRRSRPRVDLGALALGLWALGALLLLARALAAQVALHRLERSSTEVVDDGWRRELEALRTELDVRAPVRLLAHRSVTTPMTWGVRAPVIALPPAALRWSPDERRVVLLHELAHVRRRDAARLLVARLACILHWPDPLSWKTLRRLAVEHELACDRAVLERGVLPSSYAQQLLQLSRAHPTPRLSGALAMARRTSLEVRVMSILDPRSSSSPRVSWRRSLAALTLLGLLGAGAAVLAPAPPAAAVVRAPLAVPVGLAGAALRTGAAPGETTQPPSGESAESLGEALAAARELESEMHVYEEQMRAAELEMREAMAPIQELEHRLAPHHEELRRLEMQHRELAEPLRELEHQIEAEHGEALAELERRLEEAHRGLEAESRPLQQQLEDLELELRTLVEPLRGRQEMTEATRLQVEEVQAKMEPLQRQIEELHRGLEPMHRELEAKMQALEPRRRELEEKMRALEPNRRELEEVQQRMEGVHEEMERVEESLEPARQRMEEIQRQMEPLHRKMEAVHERLDRAVTNELRAVLESHLDELGLSDADLTRATITVRDAVNFRVDDDRLRLRASRSELRELLAEVAGVAETHPAIEETVDALLDLDTRFQ